MKYKFIDLFAGIGGFHTAMHSVGGNAYLQVNWIRKQGSDIDGIRSNKM